MFPPPRQNPEPYSQYPLQDIQLQQRVSSSLFSPYHNPNEYGQQENTNEEFSGRQPLLQDQYSAQQMAEYSSSRFSMGPYYGPAPGRQPRRYKTTKRVALVGGNLILDCPVPTGYLNLVPHKGDKEFTQMRYTAVTCDPSDFPMSNYTLRQAIMGRRTELFIAMTMYNENEILFTRSMHGIMKNISYLCSRERSHTWGPNGWQKVVVCIVSDGRQKIHPRVLSVLAAMGVYQDGVAKNVVNGKPVTAHLYEYTTQLSVDSTLKLRGSDKGIVPVQILFCLKEKNAKKINSHRWFFSSFGPILNPNICVLIDVGTRPGTASIYQLWKAFDKNRNIAGACGEIRALLGPRGINLINPLIATQNFEYKISNILDKPLESVFGYISVLPGAFSAYRYSALQNDANGNGPLQKYFLGETQHGGDADIFTANMYLAEDRVLCFELVAKKNSSWVLHYVSSAYGETDVPDSVPELVSQRRRWLNGSFFAAIYALAHFRQIFLTSHPLWRKLLLMIENIYQLYNLLFQWFALANFYLTFFILSEALVTVSHPPYPPGIASLLHEILRYLYLMLISAQFIMAMGNRPQNLKWQYTAIMTFYALLMGYMLFASFWLTYVGVEAALNNSSGTGLSKLFAIFSNGPFRDIILSLTSTLLMYYIASFLFFDPWHMFTSLPQYLFLTPTYINVLNIYAFCNTHDVSWGTKGDTTVALDLGVVKEAKRSASGEQTVDVAVPTERKDIDSAYDEARLDLQKNVPDMVQHRDAKTKQEDYYKGFRTRFVILWMFSNAALIAVVTNTNILLLLGNFENRSNIYFSFILWSVAGISGFRFCGCCIYTILGVFRNY